MTIIPLTRNSVKGNAVCGIITLPFPNKTLTYETIENKQFLIPDGKYPLKLTWSPRFKKLMPLIDGVPDREGIRIHMGTKPEHSQGCVLTSYAGLENIKVFINRIDKLNDDEDEETPNEELLIEITSVV